MMEVYIVEDDEKERASLLRVLEAADYQPKAFATAEDFLAAVDSLQPEGCLLIDLRLPGISGVELMQTLIRRGSRLHIVIMTAYSNVPTAVRALQTGAFDFLEKPFRPGEIVDTVARALKSPLVMQILLGQGASALEQLAKLSSRERKVFDLLVAGDYEHEIARKLGLGTRTIEQIRVNVMRTLGVCSLPDMVRLAIVAKLGHGIAGGP